MFIVQSLFGKRSKHGFAPTIQVVYDVIIAGLGAMGSAAAYQLARHGMRVLGLDRFASPNSFGSHHGPSRVIRLTYFEHPDYVPLLRRSYELWRELERDSGADLLRITGGVFIGAPESEVVAGSLAAAQQHGLAHEQLDSAQLAARFPQFTLPDGCVGFYEPSAGVLAPEACISAHLKLAEEHGAELRFGEPVLDWSADDSGVRVTTASGEYHAAKLLLCCGAWSNDLLHDTGVSIAPTRQAVGWINSQWGGPPDPPSSDLPVWLIELPERAGGGTYYGLPEADGRIKFARHIPGPACDPHSLPREPNVEDARALSEFAARHLPALDAGVSEVQVCIYENSADGHFILDSHPFYPNVLLACGFSGHGFKFAPVIGEALADLALDGATKLPVGFLSLKRFRQ